MTFLDMIRYYTCTLPMNRVARVLARWEKYITVTEWGYHWKGGFILELVDGTYAHIHGWLETDAPWMNEAWVYVDSFGKFFEAPEVDGEWESYRVEVDR